MALYDPETHEHHLHTTPVEAAVELFWFFMTACLALTAAMLVLGGGRIIAGTGVRVAVVTMLVLFAAHGWRQHRHRADRLGDDRLVQARERRGF
jgi:hypothetical protein